MLNKRLSVQLLFAVIAGILLAEYRNVIFFGCLAAMAAELLLPLFLQQDRREIPVRLLALLITGGLAMGCALRQERQWQMEQRALCSMPVSSKCITARVADKEWRQQTWQYQLALPNLKNRILIPAAKEEYPIGSILQIRGNYQSFEAPRNEGEFDQQRYYKSKRILGKLYVKECCCIRAPEGVLTWPERLYQLQQYICALYTALLPEGEAGVLSAMAAGERALLDEKIRSLFQRAGISHILAISGMHISMIGRGIYGFLRRRKGSYLFCCVFTGTVMLLYACMTGASVSATRAVGMFLLFLAAQLLGKAYDVLSALSVLGICMLLANPGVIHDVSFQFSFLAVFAVVVTGDVLPEQREADLKRRLGQRLFAGVLLQLFTLPAVAYYYYELPVYAVFINLLVLPFLGIVLASAVLGGAGAVLCLLLGRILILPAGVILKGYLWLCRLVERLPLSGVICGRPSIGSLICYYLLLGLLIRCLKYGIEASGKRQESSEGRRNRMAAACLVTAFMLPFLLFAGKAHGFEVDFLDVGQGDASLICTAENEHIFIDGGSTNIKGVGTYRILPFLKAKGIRSIDYWILSHLDADHVNGFYEALESGYPVKCVVLAQYMWADEEKERLLKLLEERGIPILWVQAGMRLQLCQSALYFLSPNGSTPASDQNGESLVFLYEDSEITGLWTGDIARQQEQWLLKRGGLPHVNLYKAAHHGSGYSNSEDYLQAIAPEISVISCAEHNRYGHPGKDALAHIQEAGSRIFFTMKGGQIKIRKERTRQNRIEKKTVLQVWQYNHKNALN